MANFLRNVRYPVIFCCWKKTSSTKASSPTEYCLNLVKTHDYENFLCTLLLPGVTRSSAFAIRAFNIEISRIADQAKEANLAAMRINFWEETLDKLYHKNPPEHPVAQELGRVIEKHSLLKSQLKKLIKSRAAVISQLSFQNLDTMEKYAEDSVSPVYYLILEAGGIKNIHADHAASHLGKAQGLTNLLRALPYNTKRRQVLLPQDVLTKHSVPQEDLFRQRSTDAVRQVIFDVASSANIHLEKARSLKDKVPKEALTVFLPAVAISSFLEKLRKFDFDIFSPSMQQRNASLGLALFWRKLMSSY